MLSVAILNVIMLSDVMVNVVMLSAVMVNVVMLNVVMLNVVRLNVLAPYMEVHLGPSRWRQCFKRKQTCLWVK